jgi:hypothetical protein
MDGKQFSSIFLTVLKRLFIGQSGRSPLKYRGSSYQF